MGKFVVSVIFRREISSIRNRKSPQIDPEFVGKCDVIVVFDAISVLFPISSGFHATHVYRLSCSGVRILANVQYKLNS